MRRNERGERLRQIVDAGGDARLNKLLGDGHLSMNPERAVLMRAELLQAAGDAVRQPKTVSFFRMRPLIAAAAAFCLICISVFVLLRNPEVTGPEMVSLSGENAVSGKRVRLPYTFSSSRMKIRVFRLKSGLRFRFSGPGRFSVSAGGELSLQDGSLMVISGSQSAVKLPSGVIRGRLTRLWVQVRGGNVRAVLASGKASFFTAAGGVRSLPLRRVLVRTALGGWSSTGAKPAPAELQEMRRFFGEVKLPDGERRMPSPVVRRGVPLSNRRKTSLRERFFLRNGSVISGILESQDRTYLRIRTKYGKLRIHRTNVQRIEYSR